MPFSRKHRFAAVAAICILASCRKDPVIPASGAFTPEIPAGFPAPEIPAGNPITHEKVRLGKKLFFEKGLSRDSSISCGSCHNIQNAFSDPRPVSQGVEFREGFRNASPLFNLAWKDDFFRDGGVQSLELTALNSLHAENEFDSNTAQMLQRLQSSPEYQKLFKEAYSDTATINGALKAIGTFLRTLISGNSKFDEYLKGRTTSFNESEIRGMELFFSSKTSCSECHGGFNLRKEGFFNNGFFETYPDSGRQRITLNENDRAKFSVPSLRNIALTAPYMHNGSVNSLEEVVNRYNNGGYDHPSKSELIRPLNLSEGEKLDLIRFLNTLTDFTFINNEAFMPE